MKDRINEPVEHYNHQKDPLDQPLNRKIPIYWHEEHARTPHNAKFRCKEQMQVGASFVVLVFAETEIKMMMSKMNYC